MVKREKKQDLCKVGTPAMVFRGEALQTAGGLEKKDLMLNPKGKVVSIARSRIAMANYADKKQKLTERALEEREKRAPAVRVAKPRAPRSVSPVDVDAEAFADRIMAANAAAIASALAPRPRAPRKPRARRRTFDELYAEKRKRRIERAIDELQAQGITDPLRIQEVKNEIDRALAVERAAAIVEAST